MVLFQECILRTSLEHFDNIKLLQDKHYFVCQLLKPKIKGMSMIKQLLNKTALITGASHGIGLEIGRKFLWQEQMWYFQIIQNLTSKT